MSTDQRDYFKRNLFSISTLVVLIGFIVQQSKWQQKVEDELGQLKDEMSQHENDTEVHMSLKDKIDLFVPRVELDKDLRNMHDKMEVNAENINEKLDIINDYLKKNLN